MKKLRILLIVVAVVLALKGYSQCGSPMGDQTSFGSGSWIGYFYDGANNYASANYFGYNTETELFDESFCGNNCNYAINGCSVNTETFTVRFKMRKTFTDALYRITIGGDDGVRLSVDNGSTYAINGYNVQSYTTYSAVVRLNGDTRLILEYYENNGDNRVSFTYTNLGSAYGGIVAGSQTKCAGTPIDPAAFTSTEAAMFISGTPTYQWQISTNNSTWTNITSATSSTYDIPSGFTAGTTRYYRRSATNGTLTANSNTLTVTANSNSGAGDQVSYGNGSWIGYVYDGRDNYASNYFGEIFEPEIFDESFVGSNTTMSTTGCNFQTETFSVRFKMRKNFSCGDYTFTIGADDGVRLSINGGSTWLVSDYTDHGYRTVSSASTSLAAGTYDLVLEFFENGGGNRVTFNYNMISCVLPVTWHSFEGVAKQDYNELQWKTASEENNEGFSVERSTDGKSFEEIGWVNGKGTTTEQQSYSYQDSQPASGVNYYRLKQVDFDGKFDYSEIVSVTAASDVEEITLYPNPSREYVYVRSSNSEAPKMQLVNILIGKIVEPVYEGDGKFNLSDVEPGIYVARIQVGNQTSQQRLVVQE